MSAMTTTTRITRHGVVNPPMSAKRGKKAPPKSKPGKWDRPERETSHTKKGPGRKAALSADRSAPRVMAEPDPQGKLHANVGRDPRRKWRDGEPVHVFQPVRVARVNAKAKADDESGRPT